MSPSTKDVVDAPLNVPQASAVEVAVEQAEERHGAASLKLGTVLARSGGGRRRGRPQGRKSGGNSAAPPMVKASFVTAAEAREELLVRARAVIFDIQQQIGLRTAEVEEMKTLVSRLEKFYFDRGGLQAVQP